MHIYSKPPGDCPGPRDTKSKSGNCGTQVFRVVTSGGDVILVFLEKWHKARSLLRERSWTVAPAHLQCSESSRCLAPHHQVIFSHLCYVETLKDSWLKLAPRPPGAAWPPQGGGECSPSMTACFQTPCSPKAKINAWSCCLSFCETSCFTASLSHVFLPSGATGTILYTIIQIWEFL